MDQAAAPSVIAQIAYVDPAQMRGNAFFHGSVVELDIISSAVAVIGKLQINGGSAWDET